MSMMLASVSNVAEARIALAGGVDWLDVKDPRAGALGRAAAASVREIVALVEGTVPVSATLGDCWATPAVMPERAVAMAATGVAYLKIGLQARDVASTTLAIVERCTLLTPAVIIVCLAEAPPRPGDIAALAATGIAGIMLDTADKSGQRLTTLVSHTSLLEFVVAARGHDLLSGLAGRLQLADIPVLLPLRADYLGFRSALCAGGERTAELSSAALSRVRTAMGPAQTRRASEHNSEVA